MIRRAILGLGSNIDGAHQLPAAVERCRCLPGSRVLRCSSLYCSAPWGGAAGGLFHNAALLIETGLSPWDLLAATRDVERALGRRRGARYAPRSIDIDLLWYQGARLALPTLQLPHPRLLERRFALLPLCEVAPEVVLAPGLRAAAALRACTDRGAVWRYHEATASPCS